MKIFDRDGKINFVDENNVFVGYDMSQCCCESAGWFIADKPTEYNNYDTINGKIVEANSILIGFSFDKSYFAEINCGSGLDSGGMAIFRVTKDDQEKFIHIFNSQNGYYSHGFEFVDENGTMIKESCI